MPRQVAAVVALMLLFAGVGTSAFLTHALAEQKSLTAAQQEKRLGPKPTPLWYWRWSEWRLGEGYAKGRTLQRNLRPRRAPRRIPNWAWQRLHLFQVARAELAARRRGGGKGHGPPPTTSGSTSVATSTTKTTATTTTTSTTTPSSHTWSSGVYAGSPSKSSTFGTWRGRPIDLAHGFAAGNSWTDIELSSTWLSWWSNAGDASHTVVSIPMLPRSDTSTTLKGGATGAYDSHWEAAALHLVAAGMGNATLRIGWEFNQHWARWSARSDPAAYAAYWRHIVTAMRSVPGQSFRFVWCPSAADMGWDATEAWPGDGYVNMVGLDSYDVWYNHPDATPASRWNFIVNSTGSTAHGGLNYWANFASAHTKPLAISEWGVVNKYASMTGPNGGGGGDDPYYIQHMHSWLAAHNVAYEAYMETNAPDGDHKLEGTEFPNAASSYRSLWGS